MPRFSARNHVGQWATVDLNYLNEDKKESLIREHGPGAHYRPLKVQARITDYHDGSYRLHDNPYVIVQFAEPARLWKEGRLQTLTEKKVEPEAISAQWKSYPAVDYDDYHRVHKSGFESNFPPAVANIPPPQLGLSAQFGDADQRLRDRIRRSANDMFGPGAQT